MGVMTRHEALFAAVFCTMAFSSAQATRPGPMLRGGTLIFVSSRLDPVFGRSGDRRAASSQGDFLGYAQGQPASTIIEDNLLGRATESSSLFGRPSWFGQQPDMTFELFGPASKHHAHHQGCRHARAAAAEAAGMHGANLMAKHMASARFGSDGMLAAMLAIAQEDAKRLTSGNVKEEVNLDQQHPISNFKSAAIDQHESIGNMIDRLGLPSNMLPVHDARMSVSREERVAQTAGQPFFGIVDRSLGVTPGSALSAQGNGHPDGHPEVSHKWRARDFVARSVARPVVERQPAVPALEGCKHLQAFPHLQHACQRRRGQTLLKQSASGEREGAGMSWDLYDEDGQLNSGVLVFVLLCIACAAVWARLIAMWCCCALRAPAPVKAERRQRRQRRLRCELQRLRALLAGGPTGELSAPLLAPLPPEAACTRASHKVEVAATEASQAPAVNYVTLQYQPLDSEKS